MLQQKASNELGYSPKQTMRVAQNLYEAGHITYMRTDNKVYSPEFIKTIKKFIKNELNPMREGLVRTIEKSFAGYEKIKPSKQLVEMYEKYYSVSNEMVRKKYFPLRESLFPKFNFNNSEKLQFQL